VCAVTEAFHHRHIRFDSLSGECVLHLENETSSSAEIPHDMSHDVLRHGNDYRIVRLQPRRAFDEFHVRWPDLQIVEPLPQCITDDLKINLCDAMYE
jgi:hypothetical protein